MMLGSRQFPVSRRLLLAGVCGALIVASVGIPAVPASAQSSATGADKNAGAHGGGGHAGESGGHTGEDGGGGHGGGGHGAGRTPAQRAYQHRLRYGRTLGGGENTGGDTGTTGEGDHPGSGTWTNPETADGSSTGAVGGATGGEHFIHGGFGNWGVDGTVLRAP